jgi:NAD-dependent DNA ligase
MGSSSRRTRCESFRPVPWKASKNISPPVWSKALGRTLPKKLVQAFGEQVFEVIEQTPERLTNLDGIGPKRKQRVVDAWEAQKVIRAIVVFLHSHGVGTAGRVLSACGYCFEPSAMPPE